MKLGALADIRQGMAMAGHGAGARSGGWELQVVESADILEDRVTLEGLRIIKVRQSIRSRGAPLGAVRHSRHRTVARG